MSTRSFQILEAKRRAQAGKGKVRGEAKIWHMSDGNFVRFVEWMLSGVPAKTIELLCASELKMPAAIIPSRQAQSVFWKQFLPHWAAAPAPSPETAPVAEQPVSFTPVVILVPSGQLGVLGGPDFTALVNRMMSNGR